MEVTVYRREGVLPEEWAVEAIDTRGDGAVEVTLFSGPSAQDRAQAYSQEHYQRDIAEAA